MRVVPAAAALSSFLAAGFQTPAWPPPVQRVSSRSPALSAEEEARTFFMPPGYRVELVASEPMVVDPVAIDFDPDGRLYVVEMLGFMPDTSGADSREPLGRVAVLEDVDDDGRMDRRTVFLDRLILPRAVKVLDRGVLVAEPPNLWLARDANGDLEADTKDRIRDDFGRLESNPEHNANTLLWGLDNVIYTSEHTYHLRLAGGRFELQPTLIRGQWGASIDDAGRVYRNWNEQPLFVDVVPARYFMRNPNMARTRGLYEILMDPADMTVWPVRPTRGVNRGYRDGVLRRDGTLTTYVSAGTPVIYRGDRLPRDLYGNAFVTESAGNLVHRLVIEDDGHGRLSARNAYERGEFLASTDERFRPVNLFSAPDGTLYVVDMYRGVIQDGQYWTDYLRDYIKSHELETPVGRGRIWRVVHESSKRDRRPSLSRLAGSALVTLLSHPNGWHRDTAQRLIVERGDRSVVPLLEKLALSSGDHRAVLHAVWTIDGLDALTPAIVHGVLAHHSADVRSAAVRLAERWIGEPDHDLQSVVARMADDANWGVRRQVAASLGALPEPSRTTHLAAMLERHGTDPIVVDAAISGLGGVETTMLQRLLQSGAREAAARDAVTMLAAAIARRRDATAIEGVVELAADAGRSMWQRAALLEGVGIGLDAGGGRGGRGRGGAARGGTAVTFARTPVRLIEMGQGSGPLAETARRIAARAVWPGKPVATVEVVPLTPDQQKRFADGQEIYKNLCSACHQPDGRGREKVAPGLVNSRYAVGDASIPMRVILAGKEGPTGLMPPLGGTLSDEQIAAVLTYVRREWGHAASPVEPAEVREVRGMTASRRRPWTEAELAALASRPGGGGP